MPQSMHHGAKRPGHGGCIDHGEHRNPQQLGQIGSAGLTVKQTHDPLNKNQITLRRRLAQPGTDITFTIEPQVQVVHCPATGQKVPVRVQKIRSALEDTYPHAAGSHQPCNGRGNGGFSLPGGRRSHHQGGTKVRLIHGLDQLCGDQLRPMKKLRPGVAYPLAST